jgi:peptidoglycan/xylan/chitin deacetylase (PgdA/CDA1 family)
VTSPVAMQSAQPMKFTGDMVQSRLLSFPDRASDALCHMSYSLVRDIVKGLLSWNFILPCAPPRKFIFCYDDISTAQSSYHAGHLYSHDPSVFAAQIDFLSRLFEWKSLEELLRPIEHRRHQAALTFDDGFRSVRDVAMPILEAKGIPFSVFVSRSAIEHNFLPITTAFLLSKNPDNPVARELDQCARDDEGQARLKTYPLSTHQQELLIRRMPDLQNSSILGERIYMNGADLQDLRQRGVSIGNHSTTHRILSGCDADTLTYEIEVNKTYLSDTFGSNPRYFAIPCGKKEHYNGHVLDTVRKSGYDFVLTTNPTFFSNRDLIQGRWLIPRIGPPNEVSMRRLLFYLNRCFVKNIDI